MSEYASSIALAQRLINKKGRVVTVSKATVAPADPAKPWDADQTAEETVDLRAVAFPVESKYVDGTTVVVTDKQMYVAAADTTFPITTQCKVTDKGYQRQVIMVDELEPGEDRVMYTLVVR